MVNFPKFNFKYKTSCNEGTISIRSRSKSDAINDAVLSLTMQYDEVKTFADVELMFTGVEENGK